MKLCCPLGLSLFVHQISRKSKIAIHLSVKPLDILKETSGHFGWLLYIWLEVGTSPAMFVVTKDGILIHNMIFHKLNQCFFSAWTEPIVSTALSKMKHICDLQKCQHLSWWLGWTYCIIGSSLLRFIFTYWLTYCVCVCVWCVFLINVNKWESTEWVE